MSALLNVAGLNAWYGESHILHGVDLHVNEGEMICILGRNGMGKTTTLRSIMGILRKRTGSITFAGSEQHLDTGTKVYHMAPNTSSTVSSKSISKSGGIALYRSDIHILPEAVGSKSSVVCESLMMDSESRADTIPVMDIRNDQVDIGHEARIGRISDSAVFYLMTRGLSENEAKDMIVRGFVEPIAKELPLEYAVEMNRLISLELQGTIG